LQARPLFERSQRQVIMTELGKQLYPGIQTILRELHTLEEIAAQSRGLLQNTAAAGHHSDCCSVFGPGSHPSFARTASVIPPPIARKRNRELLDELHAGEIDAIVAALPIDDERLAQRKLFDDRFLIATSTNDQTVSRFAYDTGQRRSRPVYSCWKRGIA
jgi:LysR family hydrogen peroxide-inducible transcriptional activator